MIEIKTLRNGEVINPESYPHKVFKTFTRVDMVEYERGWGSKLDRTMYFETREQALRYASEYDKRNNNKSYVPDWYMKPVVY